jgi:hypothetical protein
VNVFEESRHHHAIERCASDPLSRPAVNSSAFGKRVYSAKGGRSDRHLPTRIATNNAQHDGDQAEMSRPAQVTSIPPIIAIPSPFFSGSRLHPSSN